jgi:hypothetical protein
LTPPRALPPPRTPDASAAAAEARRDATAPRDAATGQDVCVAASTPLGALPPPRTLTPPLDAPAAATDGAFKVPSISSLASFVYCLFVKKKHPNCSPPSIPDAGKRWRCWSTVPRRSSRRNLAAEPTYTAMTLHGREMFLGCAFCLTPPMSSPKSEPQTPQFPDSLSVPCN